MATLDELDVKVDEINSRLDHMNGMLEERCKAQRQMVDLQIENLKDRVTVGGLRADKTENRFWGLLVAVVFLFAGQALNSIFNWV